MGLLTCDRCRRHCRSDARSCPFCGARRLVVRAGVITFATLGIGWTDDGGAAGADARPTLQDAGAGDGQAPDVGAPDREQFHDVIPLYGAPPPPHRPGC